MDTGVVGHAHLADLVLPVKRMFTGCCGKHIQECPIEPFDLSVTLRVVWGCPCFQDLQQLADLMDDLGFELSSLIRM